MENLRSFRALNEISDEQVPVPSPLLQSIALYGGIIGGGLAAIGSLFVIISYFTCPNLRSQSRKLVCYLSMTDLGQGLFFCLPFFHPKSLGGSSLTGVQEILCFIDSLVGIFFANSSFLWTACISYYVLINVRMMLEAKSEKNQLLFTIFHCISWGFPFLTVILVAAFVKTGNNDDSLWCFIPREDGIWRLTMLYIPLWVCWLFTTTTYIYSITKLCQASEIPLPKSQELIEVQSKLILIPLLWLFVRVWGSIYRLFEIFSPYTDVTWLLPLMAIGDSSQGIFNFIIFVLFTKKVREEYKQLFLRCFCRSRQANSYQSVQDDDV